MLQKTEGLVIKTVKFSESAIIAKIFTREFGWLNFHIPGVRSSRNKSKGNLFQPLQFLELDIYHHPGKNLLKIKEHRPAYIYRMLPFDMSRQSVAIFELEILSKCLHEAEVNTALYDFSRSAILTLDNSEKLDLLSPQKFMLSLSQFLGFGPLTRDSSLENIYFHLEEGTFNEHEGHPDLTLGKSPSQLLQKLLMGVEINFNATERQLLIDSLISYFKIHVPGFYHPSSLEILHQILR